VPQGGTGTIVGFDGWSCLDQNGGLLPTPLYFSTAAPAGVTLTIGPNPTNENWNCGLFDCMITTQAVAVASTAAPLGVTSLNFSVSPQGECFGGGYAVNGANPSATVVPPIQGPKKNFDFVWWFNGESPSADYPTKAVLDSGLGNISGPFVWTITTGADKVAFSNGQSSITVANKGTLEVHSIGAGSENAPYEVTVNLTAAPGASNANLVFPPFMMKVYEPYKVIPLLNKDACSPPNAIMLGSGPAYPYPYGYACSQYYSTVDNAFRGMRGMVPVNEYFSALTYIPPNMNCAGQTLSCLGYGWQAGVPCGQSGVCVAQPLNMWRDLLMYPEATPGQYNPDVVTPAVGSTPNGSNTILTVYGGWWIGGTAPQTGVQVQANLWVAYADHAKHADLQGPPF